MPPRDAFIHADVTFVESYYRIEASPSSPHDTAACLTTTIWQLMDSDCRPAATQDFPAASLRRIWGAL
jgi:hypothetical protein